MFEAKEVENLISRRSNELGGHSDNTYVTLYGGWGGYPKCHQISHGGSGLGKNVKMQFLFVISLVKVNKS